MSERVDRSVMNIKVGIFFYTISLSLAFYSRKVFLSCLGDEFIGLTGILMNIMSYLSVAELGIGTSIVFFLYKPLQENNHVKINEIVSMLAYLYRRIGCIIFFTGAIVSIFFPLWFKNISFGLPLVYFAFYSFLASSASGYFFNYRQLLVSANQKQYVVNSFFQSVSIIQNLIQILLAYHYRNLYIWIIIGFVFSIIGIIIFNHRINKEYPWLRIDMKNGKECLKRYPEVLKKTRQIFVQRIKNLILYRSDEILVGVFVSFTQVACYGNYMIIINKLNFLTNILSDGMNAGIGNLIAEGNTKNTMKVFWELTSIRFLICGIIIFSLIMFLQPFITCWLGDEYRLSDIIVFLLIFNIFIFLSRGVVEMYISACGLFSDVWAAWTELIINILVTLCLAPSLGITGILIGKITSVFFIALIWKPYFLFSKGLHQNISTYWRGMIPYYTITSIFTIISIIIKHLVTNNITTFTSLIINGIIIFPLFIAIYFYTMLQVTNGMKYFIARKPKIYKLFRMN